MLTTEGLHWYAVRVRSCAEAVVVAGLVGRDLRTFLPSYGSPRRWSDRRKVVQVPLFPGYVFCRFNPNQRLPVLMTPGVVGIVSCGTQPEPIPDIEVDSIRTMVESRMQLHQNPYLSVGDPVEVIRGPLKGVVGIIVEQRRGWRLVVSVNLLQRSVAVELDTSMVVSIRNKTMGSAADSARGDRSTFQQNA